MYSVLGYFIGVLVVSTLKR